MPEPGTAGLASAEAKRRLEGAGPNVLRSVSGQPLLLQFLSRFRNPLVIVLLLAATLSGFSGETTNALIIGCIVLMSVAMDFVQEFRAGQAAERLKHSVSVHTAVLRDGAAREIPVGEVVPGDVVLLAAGDLVPADGLVLEAQHFFVKQALLTGEPYPVEKQPGAAPGAALEQATNAVFMGTSVISGSARVLLVNTFQHRPLLESFQFAVALAVGLTPELLPMVVSITLSRGALAMARARVIVKRLAAIQDLGSMDVLCTDKTGTLTEAKIVLERHVDPRGRPGERVLELAYLNSYFETGLKSPLDEAILDHGHIDVSGGASPCWWRTAPRACSSRRAPRTISSRSAAPSRSASTVRPNR